MPISSLISYIERLGQNFTKSKKSMEKNANEPTVIESSTQLGK